MEKKYARRWKGFTPAQVSERMSMIALKRFKTKKEKAAFARAGVEARGSWQIVDGKRIYVRKSRTGNKA